MKELTLSKLVHLAIDVQPEFYENLFFWRARHFPVAIRKFSNQLAEFAVPTKWVVYEPDEGLPDDSKGTLIKTLELAKTGLTARDDIFPKRSEDAFNGRAGLDEILWEGGVDTVVITGMNASACVAYSAVGALRCGFRCIVITDLLADEECWWMDPIKFLRKGLVKQEIDSVIYTNRDWYDRLHFMTSAEFLAYLKQEPGMPLPATPAPNEEQIARIVGRKFDDCGL